MTHADSARTQRRALVACAGLALVALVIGLVVSGALTAGPRSDGRIALRQSDEPVSLRERSSAALESAPDRPSAASLEGVAAPLARVAVSSASPHAHLARLDIVVHADGKPVKGAFVELQGIGGVFAAPGTTLDDDDRPLTDARGRVSVFVRPLVTWYGDVATNVPRWAGEFVADAPHAGSSHEVEVDLEPTADARCVHLAFVSLPSGAPLGGVAVRYETRTGGLLRAPDGSFEVVTGADGRIVLCWTEDTMLRLTAEGHTPRTLSWGDAQRPVEQLSRPSLAAAEASDPIEVELAAFGTMHGDSLPVWARSGQITLELLALPFGTQKHAQLSSSSDPLGNWRIDGVPASIGDSTKSAFRADRDVSTFDVVWREMRSRGAVFSDFIPLATDLTLGPGEARRVVATCIDHVVELDALVRIDGEVALSGTPIILSRKSAPAAGIARIASVPPPGRQADAQRLALVRTQMRFGEYRLNLVVDANGHVHTSAMLPGTYNVTAFTSNRTEFVDDGSGFRTPLRDSAVGVLEIPNDSGARRHTTELSLRRAR